MKKLGAIGRSTGGWGDESSITHYLFNSNLRDLIESTSCLHLDLRGGEQQLFIYETRGPGLDAGQGQTRDPAEEGEV